MPDRLPDGSSLPTGYDRVQYVKSRERCVGDLLKSEPDFAAAAPLPQPAFNT